MLDEAVKVNSIACKLASTRIFLPISILVKNHKNIQIPISEMLWKNKNEQTIINLKAFPVGATCNGILQEITIDPPVGEDHSFKDRGGDRQLEGCVEVMLLFLRSMNHLTPSNHNKATVAEVSCVYCVLVTVECHHTRCTAPWKFNTCHLLHRSDRTHAHNVITIMGYVLYIITFHS